jgi:hypothetical protein
MSLNQNHNNHKPAQPLGSPVAQSFSAEYLAAKKVVDDRALNKRVWRTLVQELPHCPGASPLKILEIGAGIGTMFERVVDWGLLKGKVIYAATDSDPRQTAAARAYLTSWAEKKKYSFDWNADQQALLRTSETTVELNVRQAEIEELAAGAEPPHTWDLIIAHAVLDLIDFTTLLPQLLTLLKDRGLFYTTCNFDGETSFEPPVAGDEEIINHYHESMEKRCFGASVTGRRVRDFLREQGLEVLVSGSSNWFIEPRKQSYSQKESCFLGVILAMVEKELATAPHQASKSADWIRQRRRQISAGTLSFAARHLDMLARYSVPA